MSHELVTRAAMDVRYFGQSIRLQRDDDSVAMADGWTVCERNGCIFVAYPADGGAPGYDIPLLPEHDSNGWEPWSMNRMRIATQSREIVENVADQAHFLPVHGTRFETFSAEFTGHLAIQRTTGRGSDDYPDATFETEATYHGPSFQVTRMTSRGMHAVLINAHTMIDERELDLYFGVSVQRSTHSDRFVAAYIADIQNGFGQDVAIWEHKKWRDRPVLCDGDGPIMKLRKWYAQFYDDAGAQ